MVKNKIIPDSWYIPELDLYKTYAWEITYLKRQEAIMFLGFSLIAKNWIIPLSKWIGNRKCLEIMSGQGSLSYALEQEGVSIITTDNFSWMGSGNLWKNKEGFLWKDVENIDAISAIQKYGDSIDIIICSWPPKDDNIFAKCILEMRKLNPNCLMIFIGEGYGGCTTNDLFFETAEFIEDQDFENCFNEGKYCQWFDIHDYPRLCK